MSVFTPIQTTCQICKTRPVKAAAKNKAYKRCTFCESRYDAKGNSYIIHSDIYRFHKRGRTVYIWLCDGRVNQIKAGYLSRRSLDDFDGLINQSKSFMMDFMRSKGFEMQNESYASS